MEEILGLVIRPVCVGEGEVLDEVFCASIRGLTAPLYTFEQQEAWIGNSDADRWNQRLSEIDFWIAEVDGVVAGFVSIDQPNRVLDHIFVHPSFAGRGIGAAMMLFALDKARNLGFEQLTLNASDNALPFYESFGWVKIAQICKTRGTVELPCTEMRIVL